MRRPLIAFCALLIPAALAAQDHQHEAPAAAGRIGRVRFPTSCNAPAAAAIERGVTLLHSFWFDPAGAAFRDAIAADSTCAMAQWGLATSYLHPLWAPPTPAERQAGAQAAARAVALAPATGRERGYIDAIAAYWRDAETAPHGARLRAWEQGLRQLHTANPSDTEAAVFHALSLIAIASKTDTSYPQLREAGAILEPIFARQPTHPGAAHYIIHSYDAPGLVNEARRAADRYAGIAPSVPHALHMPSHSYTLLGMWDQSVSANRRSNEAAKRFERDQRMDGTWDQGLHAMDYLVYAWLQQGQDSLALGIAAEAAAVRRIVPAGSPTAEYALAAIPARMALERSAWTAAAALPPRDSGPPHARAVRRFTRALGAARSGNLSAARAELVQLDSLEALARASADPFALPMVRVNRLAARSWVLLASGDTTGAVLTAAEAADAEDGALKNPLTPGPLLSARELMGDMLVETGQHAAALVAYRAALEQTPRRSRILTNGIAAAERAGDAATAREWRAELARVKAGGAAVRSSVRRAGR